MKTVGYRDEGGLLPPAIEIPRHVFAVMRRMHDNGWQVYAVGGCIRDRLSGKQVTDWDLATDATPAEVMQYFERVIPTGARHGTVTILTADGPIEVTTFRTESGYSDFRRPDQVEFVSDIRADLSRRDFTVNAMAYNPWAATPLCDPFDGRADLQRGILRAVGVADERFVEDPLRTLRAARFVAQLGFCIERKTQLAMGRHAKLLDKISRERIRVEFEKLLASRHVTQGLELMYACDLLRQFAPFLHVDAAEWRRRQLASVAHLPADPLLRLAVMIEIELKASGAPQLDGRRIAELDTLLHRLTFPNRGIMRITRLLANQPLYRLPAGKQTPYHLRQFAARLGGDLIDDRLALSLAQLAGEVEGARSGKSREKLLRLKDQLDEVVASGVPLSVQEMSIGGKDVMQICGLMPGKRVGACLQELLHHVWRNPDFADRGALVQLLIESCRRDLFCA